MAVGGRGGGGGVEGVSGRQVKNQNCGGKKI